MNFWLWQSSHCLAAWGVDKEYPVREWLKFSALNHISLASFPLCSLWQVKQEFSFTSADEWYPFPAVILDWISVWQTRHFSSETLLPSTWHLVQFEIPSRPEWEFDKAPGESGFTTDMIKSLPKKALIVLLTSPNYSGLTNQLTSIPGMSPSWTQYTKAKMTPKTQTTTAR